MCSQFDTVCVLVGTVGAPSGCAPVYRRGGSIISMQPPRRFWARAAALSARQRSTQPHFKERVAAIVPCNRARGHGFSVLGPLLSHLLVHSTGRWQRGRRAGDTRIRGRPHAVQARRHRQVRAVGGSGGCHHVASPRLTPCAPRTCRARRPRETAAGRKAFALIAMTLRCCGSAPRRRCPPR